MLKKTLLALFIMCSILFLPFQTHASEETTPNTPDNTYNYYWYDTGTKYDWYWSDTPHYIRDSSGSHYIVIFRLANSLNSEEFVPAYCCDLSTGITHGTTYRRINLEDSTYYDDTAAGHIRGIFSHGYWPVGTDMNDVKSMESAANAWLDANNYPTEPENSPEETLSDNTISDEEGSAVDTYRIHNLTAAQAITATQAAIWYYSNTGATITPYAGTASFPYTDQFFDSNVDITEESDEYTKSNVELFYTYLINQSYEPPRKILFANDHFVESTKIESEQEDLYNITLYFRLESPITAGEELSLTAALGSKEQTYDFNVTGTFQPSAEGYYAITFQEISKEDALNGISLSIDGFQMADDVYFYEAKPTADTSSRDISQNLVGYASGKTPVHAELTVDFTLPEKPADPEEPTEPESPTLSGPSIGPEDPKDPSENTTPSKDTPSDSTGSEAEGMPETSAPAVSVIAAAPKTGDFSADLGGLSLLCILSCIALIMNVKRKFS